VHCDKGRGEASKAKSLKIVSLSVLEKDRATNGRKVKSGSNTFSRSVNGASLTKSNSKEKKDL